MSPTPVRIRRALALALALAWAFAACGPNPSNRPSGPVGSGSAACATAPSVADDLPGWGPPATAPELTPFIIASPGQLVCGPNRVLFTVLDKDSRPAGAPDLAVKVEFFNLGRAPEAPILTVDGAFVWAIEDDRGSTSQMRASGGGTLRRRFPGGPARNDRLTFDVQPSSPSSRAAIGNRLKDPHIASVAGISPKFRRMRRDRS